MDNPSLDVRMARVGTHPGRSDGLPAVLASAANMRPTDGPAAIVVPLLALPFPAVTDAIRYAVTQSNVNAFIAEPFNVSLTFAEALHIRLADAHLARADRVRMFSIPTAADGIIVATVGGDQAAAAAIPTSVLLAARLALPVFAAALDGRPSIGEAAAQLRQMGVGRIAIAPCIIGPEARPGELEAACASIRRRFRGPARRARQRGQAHDPRLRAGPGRDRVTPGDAEGVPDPSGPSGPSGPRPPRRCPEPAREPGQAGPSRATGGTGGYSVPATSVSSRVPGTHAGWRPAATCP